MNALRWFIGGTLAVPIFHQAVIGLLYAAGWIPRAPFVMTPTKPFGVPQLISISFWGGVWGILLGLILTRPMSRARFWTIAIVFGALAPTLVGMFVINPLLKGQPLTIDVARILIGFLVNAAWGFGTALIYTLLSGRRTAA